jgi:hypothetical protein
VAGGHKMMKGTNLYDETARVAYELHEKREKIHGYDLADWLEAERLVLERYAKEIETELEKTSDRKT